MNTGNMSNDEANVIGNFIEQLNKLKMKTALQELLSWAKHPIEDGEVNHSLYSKINELMGKEKQQIVDAFEEGVNIGMNGIYAERFSADIYLNSKYNQNDKDI